VHVLHTDLLNCSHIEENEAHLGEKKCRSEYAEEGGKDEDNNMLGVRTIRRTSCQRDYDRNENVESERGGPGKEIDEELARFVRRVIADTNEFRLPSDSTCRHIDQSLEGCH